MLLTILFINVCVSGTNINNGSVAEWSKAAVLKTVGGNASVGSNPTASAISAYNESGSYSSEVCLQCKQIVSRDRSGYSVYKMNTEGWLSVLRYSPAKGADRKVSWVRIPPLPPFTRRCRSVKILSGPDQRVLYYM